MYTYYTNQAAVVVPDGINAMNLVVIGAGASGATGSGACGGGGGAIVKQQNVPVTPGSTVYVYPGLSNRANSYAVYNGVTWKAGNGQSADGADGGAGGVPIDVPSGATSTHGGAGGEGGAYSGGGGGGHASDSGPGTDAILSVPGSLGGGKGATSSAAAISGSGGGGGGGGSPIYPTGAPGSSGSVGLEFTNVT